MKHFLLVIAICLVVKFSFAQTPANKWADSVYKTLSNDERIGQLMVVRLSTYDARTKTVTFFDSLVTALSKTIQYWRRMPFSRQPCEAS